MRFLIDYLRINRYICVLMIGVFFISGFEQALAENGNTRVWNADFRTYLSETIFQEKKD